MQKQKFKQQFSLEQRLKESESILKHYQDRVPIIIEKDRGSKLPDLDVQKYLQCQKIFYKQIDICFYPISESKLNLNKAEAVYLFVNSKIALRGGYISFFTILDMTIKEVYESYKDEDKFLYIQYCEYNTFG